MTNSLIEGQKFHFTNNLGATNGDAITHRQNEQILLTYTSTFKKKLLSHFIKISDTNRFSEFKFINTLFIVKSLSIELTLLVDLKIMK